MEASKRTNVDQENAFIGKNKQRTGLRQPGLSLRALGDSNVLIQRQDNVGKVAVAAAEFEKKATQNRMLLRSNSYGHVQSKIDTGLSGKSVQPTCRPPLRREESTAGLAARAAMRTRVAMKENLNTLKPIKSTESRNLKESSNFLKKSSSQDKENKIISKLPLETKKILKQPKETKALKPIIKQSTESLEKLKLAEKEQEKLEELNQSIILPPHIEDIDADEKNGPLLMSIYIKEIYRYLTELETMYPIEPDHLKKQTVITGKMRATLIDWLVDVQKQFSLVLETFQLTVGILDRYLQMVPNVQRDRLQLVGVTAMYIASKYEEIYAPDVSDFVYVTDNAYSKQDVFQCEREMLQKLGFCLARPIPLSFLRRFVRAAHGTSKHHHLAKYLVDLCLVEYSMAHYRPSELAAAAVCLSLHLLSDKKLEEVWTPTLAYYSEYDLDHIEPIIKKIARVVINVENSKFKAVYKKYQDVTLAKVSTLPHLKGEAILELANSPSPHTRECRLDFS